MNKLMSEGFWGGVKFGVYCLLILLAIDLVVVFFTMLQIGSGVDTPHIAFWDEQIRFIVHIFK